MSQRLHVGIDPALLVRGGQVARLLLWRQLRKEENGWEDQNGEKKNREKTPSITSLWRLVKQPPVWTPWSHSRLSSAARITVPRSELAPYLRTILHFPTSTDTTDKPATFRKVHACRGCKARVIRAIAPHSRRVFELWPLSHLQRLQGSCHPTDSPNQDVSSSCGRPTQDVSSSCGLCSASPRSSTRASRRASMNTSRIITRVIRRSRWFYVLGPDENLKSEPWEMITSRVSVCKKSTSGYGLTGEALCALLAILEISGHAVGSLGRCLDGLLWWWCRPQRPVMQSSADATRPRHRFPRRRLSYRRLAMMQSFEKRVSCFVRTRDL